jgi:hypothetical protein
VEDEIGRCLLSQLDGTRDRLTLAEEVRRLIESKDAYVESDAPPQDRCRKILEDLDRNLNKLARLGLLVG